MPASKRIVNATCCCGGIEQCECCEEGTTQRQYAVTFADVVPLDPVECEDCLDWNDCWELPEMLIPADHPCDYIKQDDEVPCPQPTSDADIVAWIHCDDSPGSEAVWIDVEVYSVHAQGLRFFGTIYFQKTILGISQIDCSEDFGIIPLSAWNPSLMEICDWTNCVCSMGAGDCP